MNKPAFKTESRAGKDFENLMRPILESVGALSIDGKMRKKPIGIQYKASLNYIPMLENFKQDCWLDFVIETLQGPIFIDCKSTAITHKDITNILVKAMAYKSKFPNCKIVLIYNELKKSDRREKNKLLNSGLIDNIYENGNGIKNNPTIILEGKELNNKNKNNFWGV